MGKTRDAGKHLVTEEGMGLRRLALPRDRPGNEGQSQPESSGRWEWEDEKKHKPICPGFRGSQVSTSQRLMTAKRLSTPPNDLQRSFTSSRLGKENVFVEDIRREGEGEHTARTKGSSTPPSCFRFMIL